MTDAEAIASFVDERVACEEGTLATLLKQARRDPALVRELRDQIRIAELLAITFDEDRRDFPATLAKRQAASISRGVFVARVVDTARKGRPRQGRRRRITPRIPASSLVWWFAGVAAMLLVTVLVMTRSGEMPPQVLVTAVSGSVTADGHLLTQGQRLSAGSTLALGASDTVVMALPDGTRMTVFGEARLMLERVTDGARLALARGVVEVFAMPQITGRPLCIATDHALIEVLGTRFTLTAMPLCSILAVDEGQVRFIPRAGGEAQVIAAGGSAQLPAPRTTAVAQLPAMSATPAILAPVRTTVEADAWRPWVRFVRLVDTGQWYQAHPDKTLPSITDGGEVSRRQLLKNGGLVDVEAGGLPPHAAGIRFAYDGVWRDDIEYKPPYTLTNTMALHANRLLAWRPEPGKHVITLMPCGLDGRQAGPLATIHFTITD